MQRLNHISFVRVAAMLMVIAFHSLCFYTPNWKEFPHENQDAYYYLSWMLDGIDMSAFVFISGYLFGYHYYKGRYDDIKKFISSKAQRLLLPLVVWITIQHFILPGIARIGVGNYDFLHLWFLLMLFEIFVLAICFIDKINSLSLSKLIYFEIVLIVAGFVFGLKPTRLLSCFCFYNTVVYMPIFFAGYMITRLRNNEKIEVKLLSHFMTLYGKLVNGGGGKYMIFIGIVIHFLISYFYERPWSVITIRGIVTSIFIVYPILRYLELRRYEVPAVIQSLDTNSMGIYIIHQNIIFLILNNHRNICGFFSDHFIIGPFMLFLIALLVSWGLSIVMSRIPVIKMCLGF